MSRPNPVAVLAYILLLEAWFGAVWWLYGPLVAMGALGLYAGASLYGLDPRP